MRTKVINLIGSYEDNEALDFLNEIVGDKTIPGLQNTSVMIFSNWAQKNNKRAKKYLLNALASPYNNVKETAALRIGYLELPEALKPLEKLLFDPSPFVKMRSAWAVLKIIVRSAPRAETFRPSAHFTPILHGPWPCFPSQPRRSVSPNSRRF